MKRNLLHYMKLASMLLIVVLTISGCSKKVTDKKMSILLQKNSIIGQYTGTTNNDKADGDGILEGSDGLVINGIFSDGALVSGNIENAPITIKISGTEYKGIYTGSFKKGLCGNGKFTYESGENTAVFSGEFKDNTIDKGTVSKLPLTIKLTDSTHDGIYNGEITDGKITGEGNFKSSNVNYTGTFSDGKLSGNGKLKKSTYTVHFPDVDREGKYDGDLVDGIASGKGTFTAKNDEGTKYTYTGEWKKGLYNGQGTRIYSDVSYKEYGNFVDSEFKPSVSECLTSLGTFKNSEYTIHDKSISFLDKNESIFLKKCSKNKAKRYVDSKLTFSKYARNPDKFGNKLITIHGYVNQVLSNYAWIYDKTDVIVTDNNENVYNITFLKKQPQINQGDYINIYALPLDYSTYKTVNNSFTWAIFCAGVYAE